MLALKGVSMMQQPLYPPPIQRRNHWLLVILLCGIFYLAGGLSTYLALSRASSQNPSLLPLPSPIPSPTVNPLRSPDFSTFLSAFTVILQQRDYATLQQGVDTEHFQAIYMRPSPFPYQPTDPGPYNWQTINQAMLTQGLRFTILSPPLTADQAGYSCFGYGPSGIAYLHLTIDAKMLMYVVGTAQRPGPVADPLVTPNGTIFVFELPKDPSPVWLWRAVTFNNSLGCE